MSPLRPPAWSAYERGQVDVGCRVLQRINPRGRDIGGELPLRRFTLARGVPRPLRGVAHKLGDPPRVYPGSTPLPRLALTLAAFPRAQASDCPVGGNADADRAVECY
jgi:hypothetical protein